MVAQLADPKPKSMRQIIVDWITEDVRDGVALKEASERCLQRIKKTGFSDVALDAIGANALADIWRLNQHRNRQALMPGQRRVNTGRLKELDALSDCLFEVSGLWLRLGDLKFNDCEELAGEYESRAEGNLKWARFFRKIAVRLEGNDVISDRYDEDQLRGLLEEVANV